MSESKALKPLEGFSWNPYLKYPRNKPCYCGSEKKYKKCCLETEPAVIAENIRDRVSEIVKAAK